MKLIKGPVFTKKILMQTFSCNNNFVAPPPRPPNVITQYVYKDHEFCKECEISWNISKVFFVSNHCTFYYFMAILMKHRETTLALFFLKGRKLKLQKQVPHVLILYMNSPSTQDDKNVSYL